MTPARFVRKHLIGPNIWEFSFSPVRPIDYTPGQYVHVSLPDVTDSRGHERTFTLTSMPGDVELSFAVKFPDPHSAYKTRLLSLEPGDQAGISQAMGDLVLPRDVRRPLIFVAGGLGIASFVSIMKQLTHEHSPRRVRLLYGHKPDERLYDTLIANCPGLEFLEFISPDHMGVRDIVDADRSTVYFISGGEAFTMHIREQLLDASIPATNIVYDYFDGYKGADL